MMHSDIRAAFKAFCEAKGHVWVPSSSLLPADPSVLFTTAGMQQFKPYYTGAADAKHDFKSLNVASIQKCVRTSDIDEVGDESHLTFFEMLGNFSFGGYFKEEAIALAHEFITKTMHLAIDYVSVFGGEKDVPADEESERIWKTLDPNIKVKRSGRTDNFWGPTGDEGPCGPTTEVYLPTGQAGANGVEIWNIVFNQYYREKNGTLRPLDTPGIDTGMGLERLAMVVQDVPTVFETDLFAPLMSLLPEALEERTRRIIADHCRAVAFMVADGIRPSNKDQGYVLRRLIRRVLVHEDLAHEHTPFSADNVLETVVKTYAGVYPELKRDVIQGVFDAEREKFSRTLARGLRELDHIASVDADVAFKLYESYGLPYEIIRDIAGEKAAALTRDAFDVKFKEHQEKSRAGAEKKFGGHGLLLDTGELKAANEEELQKVTRLHTATHLLHAALRDVLGDEVQQAGSDITVERTRFDFTFPRKLTAQELKSVEDKVNEAIERDLPVTKVTLPREEAEKTGALHFFKIKYPLMVDVYTIGAPDNWFSKEFCGGPHVTHTGELGHFTIAKEEGVSAGVRRIRATLQ